MRSKLTLFAAVCVAALALSSSASAATILQFSQPSTLDFVQAIVGATTTTLSTHGPVTSPGSIPITISQLGILPNQNIPALETYSPSLVGGVPAPGSNVAFGFNGTIVISIPGVDPNVLTAVIMNGRLDANGAAGGFNAATNTTNNGSPTVVTLSSDNAAVIAAMGGTGATFTTPGAVALALINISPLQSGSGFTSFTSQNQGSFSTVSIPEPASFISAGTAILAGLGCFGWSRRKSSKA